MHIDLCAMRGCSVLLLCVGAVLGLLTPAVLAMPRRFGHASVQVPGTGLVVFGCVLGGACTQASPLALMVHVMCYSYGGGRTPALWLTYLVYLVAGVVLGGATLQWVLLPRTPDPPGTREPSVCPGRQWHAKRYVGV